MTAAETARAEIHVKLSTTNVYTRWACTTCGDLTEKHSVVATYEDADGDEHYMCRDCLWAGADGVASRLRTRAGELEAWAAFLRTMAEERWVIPTHEEWETVAQLDPVEWLPDDEPAESVPSPEELF